MSLSVRKVSLPTWIVILGLVVLFVSCKKADAPSYKVFANPEDAGNALLQAAKSGDQNEVLAVFGPESKKIIYSSDAVQDKAAADAFIQGYGVMHRWRKMPDGCVLPVTPSDKTPNQHGFP